MSDYQWTRGYVSEFFLYVTLPEIMHWQHHIMVRYKNLPLQNIILLKNTDTTLKKDAYTLSHILHWTSVV